MLTVGQLLEGSTEIANRYQIDRVDTHIYIPFRRKFFGPSRGVVYDPLGMASTPPVDSGSPSRPRLVVSHAFHSVVSSPPPSTSRMQAIAYKSLLDTVSEAGDQMRNTAVLKAQDKRKRKKDAIMKDPWRRASLTIANQGAVDITGTDLDLRIGDTVPAVLPRRVDGTRSAQQLESYVLKLL